MPAGGTLYDGISARPRPAVLTPGVRGIVIEAGGAGGIIDWSRLRRHGERGLRDVARPDWRVVLDRPLPADVAARIKRHGTPGAKSIAAMGTGTAAAAALVIGLWLGGGWLVDRAASLVPRRVSEPIGRSFVGDFGRACTGPAGTRAIARLQARLTPPGGFAEPITVTIVDSPVVNALALPGGQVVVFSRLIAEAASPDELAGVLAHEFAHVDRRHPVKALVRQMGVSIFARSIGGDMGGAADLALLLRGSREAEFEADSVAIPMLRRARISPEPLAAFFERQQRAGATGNVRQMLAGVGRFASTHPADADRAALFRAAALAGSEPAMPVVDWQSIRAICRP